MKKKVNILVVDDQPYERESICALLEGEGHTVKGVSSGEEALEQIGKGRYGLVVTDLRMPGMEGREVTRRMKAISPQTEIIVVTAYGEIPTAVDAIRNGASDYITKGAGFPEMLLDSIGRLRLRSGESSGRAPSKVVEIIGENSSIQEAKRLAGIFARHDDLRFPILILGETGTGKDLFAKFIHQQSPRNQKPYVEINCAELQENLAESVLFGHEKGAFTNALNRHIGLFEQAHQGTLFFDEAGLLSQTNQGKLLRAIEQQEITRLGGVHPIPVNVRIIAATNSDLKKEVAEGRFREDLYHRLHGFDIHLPPLRDRKEDILILTNHFLRQFGGENKTISESAMQHLLRYPWPGNVRELRIVIHRAVIVSGEKTISEKDLHHELLTEMSTSRADKNPPPEKPEDHDSLPKMERKLIVRVLRTCQGNIHQASKRLGISRQTLYSKISRRNIRAEEYN